MVRNFGALLISLLLSACGGVPNTYHNLRPEITAHTERQGTPIAIRYTELPSYYDKEYLTYYDKTNRIIINKSHHWIYPFENNFRDVLRQKLSAKTGNSRIYTYPIGDNIRPEIIIDLQIRELIADLSQQKFILIAQWQNNKNGNGKPENHQYQQLLPLTNTDPDSIVDATAQAINLLAEAIAQSL
ncbi:MAG: ABC-type transport auxiliary lipoprotein family protein [Cardiobacteriaceae bacterium]|nr:ABC-type transport auxiliary lipoprotein family protein [Cardiobacteriaceae bacterium]